MFPRRSFKSLKLSARQRMAIISDAAVMSKPVSRGIPELVPPNPTMMWRKERSFMSITLFQVMVRGSRPREEVLLCTLLSIKAANKLWAFSIALKSPVKWRLISSIGRTCEYPPPVAPPLIPNTGPKEGSRSTTVVFLPIRFNPSVSPIETVVLPSPAGVGEIADTRIRCFPCIFCGSMRLSGNFALYFPYSSISSGLIPSFAAICVIGFSCTWLAISMSVIVLVCNLSWVIILKRILLYL